MKRKAFLIDLYTQLKEEAIEKGFPNGWQVLLSDAVIKRLNANIDPKKVEDWAVEIDKMWKKIH